MCVAMPMKLVELEGHEGVAEMDGVRLAVNTMLLPGAKTGDYVIVHAGYAIQRLDVEEAERNLELYRQYVAQSREVEREE